MDTGAVKCTEPQAQGVVMLKNIVELIKVKTIVTIIVLAVWAYLAVTGAISADAVNNVTLMVIAFYFGTQYERKGKE